MAPCSVTLCCCCCCCCRWWYLLLGLLVLRPAISSLLQSATTVITNCDSLFYYKVRWSVSTKFDSYYKVRQFYCKVRQNTRAWKQLVDMLGTTWKAVPTSGNFLAIPLLFRFYLQFFGGTLRYSSHFTWSLQTLLWSFRASRHMASQDQKSPGTKMVNRFLLSVADKLYLLWRIRWSWR